MVRTVFCGQDEKSALHIREVKIRHDEEEKRAAHEHIIVVLVDIGERTRTSFGDCICD